MAQTNGQFMLSRPAGADLSDEQYKFVKLNSSEQIVICAAATDRPIGILQNKPSAAGKVAEVMVTGMSKLDAGAAITVDALIGTAADGQGDIKVPGTDTTEYVCGVALEAASAADEIISAFVNCLNPHRGA